MSSRVRVEGDLFHGRVPEGAVYVGRSAPGLHRSYFHNPFRVGGSLNDSLYGEGVVRDREHAVALFEEYVRRRGWIYLRDVRDTLAGRDLACWCALPKPGQPDICHAAVLLRLAGGELL